jgi:uncharacterized membrane protein (UPF0136 family)
MPLSSIQAAVVSLVTAAVGLVVGLGFMSPASGGTIVSIAGIVVGALFTIANAIIHNGVTAAKGRDASE